MATLSKDGLLNKSPATIFTYGGGTIDPLNPDPADIQIETIAHALGNLCRWTGHVTEFYSVAEHCVHCSHLVPEDQALAALLHDASEAYLCDLARPVKHAPGLGEIYLKVETRLEQAIAIRFDTPQPPMSPEIKLADDAMLHREAKELVPHLGVLMPDPPENTPYPICWGPRTAEAAYLMRFDELTD